GWGFRFGRVSTRLAALVARPQPLRDSGHRDAANRLLGQRQAGVGARDRRLPAPPTSEPAAARVRRARAQLHPHRADAGPTTIDPRPAGPAAGSSETGVTLTPSGRRSPPSPRAESRPPGPSVPSPCTAGWPR